MPLSELMRPLPRRSAGHEALCLHSSVAWHFLLIMVEVPDVYCMIDTKLLKKESLIFLSSVGLQNRVHQPC